MVQISTALNENINPKNTVVQHLVQAIVPENYKTTADVIVPDRIIDQVIGQDESVELIKKAAAQKRNVLLVGLPGTGKSLLAQAMAEILPLEKLNDILIYPNPADSNNPKVRVVPAGEAKKIVQRLRMDSMKEEQNMRMAGMIFPLFWFLLSFIIWSMHWISDVIYAATMIMGGFLIVGFAIGTQVRPRQKVMAPKLLVDNHGKKIAPFFEGTGAKAGALLGDVRHDPLQSGGLGTPAHLRVEPGLIHRSNKGVLFVDEIAALNPNSQQELLTAMQEKKYSITGQSELSSGSMVRTDPVPCDFVLVAAGNYRDMERVHPALRSRIRGYGYEVYMNNDMTDTLENRKKVVQFVAQEVKKDGKIPHFDRLAVEQILFEARRRASRKNHLTLQLRELGGLIRAAGDIAINKAHSLVFLEDLMEARISARTLEQQIMDKVVENKRDYEVYLNVGARIGRVNGLAVTGDGSAGMVLPIEAEVAPAASRSEGKIIATGKLGEIAKEAVQNVSALIKKISGKDISSHDLHIQFLQTYEGVEGDSASVSVAAAVVSALERIPIKQSLAMTGSLSVRGEVLPVGGVTAKTQAAIKAKFKEVIVPRSNLEDIVLTEEEKKQIKLIPVSTLEELLDNAFVKSSQKTKLLKSLRKILTLDVVPKEFIKSLPTSKPKALPKH
ncbi:MAG: ATP-dependent protease LonB [Candidatus Diapherotrites archaeon]|nr:ATP-dependent protease LonB [Candidatus Diapherotrites archaeon]